MAAMVKRIPLRVPRLQFVREVRPLVQQLAARFADSDRERRRVDDAGCIERVASGCRLLMNGEQVRSNARTWFCKCTKPRELRMVRVATSATAENGLSEERFPPDRHQPRRVEVFRMERPEPHSGSVLCAATRFDQKLLSVGAGSGVTVATAGSERHVWPVARPRALCRRSREQED